MNLVQCIKGSRCAFIILLGILVVACILMGLLSTLEDEPFVEVFMGIAMMAGVCWTINFVTLVMLLVQAQLQALETETEEEEE